ncbi:hypothetical protein ACFY4B_22090 [Kitasatospora sp. NPDC001261]|uniref:hypothetical protein n=1 Tax=Kitasatospora sp. NPDC001261 TaxID=3364012 RepID=UPI0036967E58
MAARHHRPEYEPPEPHAPARPAIGPRAVRRGHGRGGEEVHVVRGVDLAPGRGSSTAASGAAA